MVARKMQNLIVVLLLALVSLPAFAIPKIHSWETDNGARVLFVKAPVLPMVDIRVVFDAGSARDGEVPGIALFANSLLSEGAGPWDADEIAERLEGTGAVLSADSLRDMALVSLRSLTQKDALETALETFSAVIAKPRFAQTAIDRNLELLKVVFRQEKQSPSSIASKAFYKALYGDHPYAHPSNGSEKSLPLLTRDAIVKFHRQYYVASNAVIAIVGDLSLEQAHAVAQKVVAGLPRGQHAPPIPAVKPLAKAKAVNIHYPSKQAHLYLGQPALTRLDPDYFPLYVGNHVLGGSGLVSQIAVEVREKRGLAYSAYSYFVPMRGAGPFMMGAQTKNSQARKTRDVLRQTLEKYRTSGPTADELKRSKQNITGGFPLRISSNRKIVEYLAVIGFYDLPLDYLDTFTDKVRAVTAEQIRDAFKRRLHPDKFVSITVGQVD